MGAPFTTVPPDIQGGPYAPVLNNTPLAAGHASIAATTLATAPLTGTYRLTVMADQTVLGTSCTAASTVAFNLIYQDPNAAAAQTVTAVGTFSTSGAGVGVLGNMALTAGVNSITFRALAGTAIQISTTYTAGTACSPGPNVQVTPILESLGQ